MNEEQSPGATGKGASAEGEMSRPPSVLWLVIPLGLILLYAALR